MHTLSKYQKVTNHPTGDNQVTENVNQIILENFAENNHMNTTNFLFMS